MINSLEGKRERSGRTIGLAGPGVMLVLGTAIASRLLHGAIPGPMLNRAISEVLVAVLLGLSVRNILGISIRFEPGIRFAVQRILRLGVILLGLRLSLQDIAATGIAALALIAACLTAALLMAYAAGRLLKIPARLAALIGVGTAICGNSAIVATAPVIEAQEDDVSYAVATITLFGLLSVLFYPIIGRAAGMTDRAFGLWAGTAVNDTSQVVATGSAYSPLALNVATIVKLTRNTLMAPLIVMIGLAYNRARRRRASALSNEAAKLTLLKVMPGFVLGFLILSLVRTGGVAAGFLPQSVDHPGTLQNAAAALRGADEFARICILMALAAVGLDTKLDSIRKTGLRPLMAGLCVAGILSAVSLSLIFLAGLG